MRRLLNPILLVACSFLHGCMAAPPIAVSTGSSVRDLSAEPGSTSDFNFDDPAEVQKVLNGIDHELVGQIIADASPGSRVSVGNFGVTYEGTLLSGGPEGVKLMNCISREAVPGPNGQKQLKTSHVPEETFKTSSMTRFVVISPPPAEFVPPDLSRDTSGLTVYDIVYRDGTRQRREIPAIPDKSDLATGSVEQE